jgi:hypothetical protein
LNSIELVCTPIQLSKFNSIHKNSENSIRDESNIHLSAVAKSVPEENDLSAAKCVPLEACSVK